MSKIRFKSYNHGQILLFPGRLDERIKEDAPVRLLNKIIDGLDLSRLVSTYKPEGTTPYDPRMLLKVVFYAYMNNIYSCRKIEKQLEENIHYMWLSGMQYPSASTINRFRSLHLKESIDEFFIQIVLMLVDLGQVSLEVQYIDGTKIESVANKYTFVWRKSVERNKQKLQAKIQSILSQIEEGIAQDNRETTEDTASPIDSASLKERIVALNQSKRVEEKEVKKQLRELEKDQAKLQEYEQKLDLMGDRNSFSKTDPDATFMRMKEDAMNNGQTKPGYNLQIATENQFVTNYALYQTPGDTTTLPFFIDLQFKRFGILPKAVSADAGYGSEENYAMMESNRIEAFVKYNNFHREQARAWRENPFLQENLPYNEQGDFFVCPMGQRLVYKDSIQRESLNKHIREYSLYQAVSCLNCPQREACHQGEGNRSIQVNHRLRKYKQEAREKLNSPQGLIHRKRRCIEPEAVFGQIKWCKQYKRFRHRGLDKINMDMGLLIMAFNIQKLWKKTVKPPKKEVSTAITAKIAHFGTHDPLRSIIWIVYRNTTTNYAA